MTERPILFSAPMVKAILTGTKTQTRRLITPQPEFKQRHEWRGEVIIDQEHSLWCWKRHTFEHLWDEYIRESDRLEMSVMSPYGVVGDRLWVREAIVCTSINKRPPPHDDDVATAVYAADDAPCTLDRWPWQRFRLPGIFMPYGCRRITLEVTEVRVQRLQEISPSDACAEGAAAILEPGHPLRAECYETHGTWTGDEGKDIDGPFAGAVDAYATLWDKINRKRATWASDPFVWAVTFRRIL